MFSNLSNFAIVVVEDNNEVRTHLGAFLDRLDAKVVLAGNAFEGLEAIKNTLPDLRVSNSRCPSGSGEAVGLSIRRRNCIWSITV
jgi:DNA-binding NtrC family response regulator